MLRKSFWELAETLSVAVILAIIIRIFLIEPFYIPSRSMEPSLYPGDRVLVNKLVYRFSQPARGDIMVFKYPLAPSKNYIKRVVGLPGETIQGRDSKIYINGKELVEDYLPDGLGTGDFDPVTIPREHYFMMGDNRGDSEDSRYWGTLERRLVKGKAVVIYWPIGRWKMLR